MSHSLSKRNDPSARCPKNKKTNPLSSSLIFIRISFMDPLNLAKRAEQDEEKKPTNANKCVKRRRKTEFTFAHTRVAFRAIYNKSKIHNKTAHTFLLSLVGRTGGRVAKRETQKIISNSFSLFLELFSAFLQQRAKETFACK